METSTSKKKNSRKFILYFLIVIIATAISLTTSLWGKLDLVLGAIGSANIGWVLVIIGIVFLCLLIEALIIKIFCRLYTRKYSMGQGLATSLTGSFYSAVTPGASGGQIMQTYTLKNQGIGLAAGASIFVMSFILYQTALFCFDVASIIVERDVIASITTARLTGSDFQLPMTPVIVLGFIVNVIVTAFIYLMSYSKTVHNLILGKGIGLLGKLKFVKDVEKTRQEVSSSVENYKIELRRLHSNIPVAFVVFVLYIVLIFTRNSIPYFAGLALDAYGGASFSFSKLKDASFLGAFQQMVTGLIPLPGGAGVSEYFFEILFYNYFSPTVDSLGVEVRSTMVNLVSAQILWRFLSFHLVLLVSGVFVALYPNKPKEPFSKANMKTFVSLQVSTIEERKLSYVDMNISNEENRFSVLKKKPITFAELKEKFVKKNKEIATLVTTKLEKKKPEPKEEKPKNQEDDWESINFDL